MTVPAPEPPDGDLPRRPLRAGRVPGGKIVITGTGRSGTTLLMQMLTRLDMSTGVRSGQVSRVDWRTRGGLEWWHIDDPQTPRVVKDPTLSTRLGELLTEGNVAIDHVIIPIRRLDIAAASRVRASRYGRNIFVRGGLYGTWRATKQREALAVMQYELMYALAQHEIPHTLLEFPRFATDFEYTFRSLWFLCPTKSRIDFRQALEAAAHTELIHEEPLNRKERLLIRYNTVRYGLALRKQQRVANMRAGRRDADAGYLDEFDRERAADDDEGPPDE